MPVGSSWSSASARAGGNGLLTTHIVRDVGLSTAEWQTAWGTMRLVDVLANPVFGYVADRVGRVRTVAWFGGLARAVTVPAFYYVAEWLGPKCGRRADRAARDRLRDKQKGAADRTVPTTEGALR